MKHRKGRVVRLYRKLLDILKLISTVIMLVCILGIVCLMLSELIVRNTINISFRFSTELNGFMFMWMAFMGLIILVDESRMINLDMIYARVPDKVREIFWVLIRVATIFLGLIMIISYKDMYPILATSKFSTMQKLTKAWHYLPSAIAGAYFVLVSVYELLNKLMGNKENEGGKKK